MVRDFSQKTVQELYETIRVNVDEESSPEPESGKPRETA